jgi:signal peptidase II
MKVGSDSRRGSRSIVVMIVGLLVLTGLDLGSKEWALDHLSVPSARANRDSVCELGPEGHSVYQREPEAARPLVHGVLNLYYAENCGAAFSMLGTAPGWLRLAVFGSTSVGAAIVLLTMFVRGSGGPLFAMAVPLIISGAVGNNLFDRPRHGFVVDFLQVHPDLFHYPIFNVADIWIVIGVALLLIDGSRNQPTTQRAPAKVERSAA